MLFLPLETDREAVERWLSPHAPLDDVSAILVGHGHYDHLMDVPLVARGWTPEATIYGSRTVERLLRPCEGMAGRVEEVEGRAATGEGGGAWVEVPDARIRFLPLVSGHADHLPLGIHLFGGEARRAPERCPRIAGQWLEGRTLAYLVDFLDEEGRVRWRLHFMDAAADTPLGFPPDEPGGTPAASTDVAILTAPGFDLVEGYPEGILGRLRPSVVMLGHWEDFFAPLSEDPEPVRSLDPSELVRRVDPVLPPGAVRIFPRPGRGWILGRR